MRTRLPIVASLLAVACNPAPKAPPAQPAPPAAKVVRLDGLARDAFNRLAFEAMLPVYWVADANTDGAVQPAEIASVWGMADETPWTRDGAFSPEFVSAFGHITRRAAPDAGEAGLAPAERLRRQKVREELAQGLPTLVRSDLRGLSASERRFVGLVLRAARVAEKLYQLQLGTDGLAAAIPADDTASRALFFRNQTWRCQAPRTLKDPACSALASPPDKVSGLYPASLLAKPGFCEELPRRGGALADPFTVVREIDGALVAVPYPQAFPAEAREASTLLAQAAQALDDPKEAPLRAYLAAASQAFLDNDWVPADEAWARMNATNSKWYLRIGPDETYAEPCSNKALFHASFGLVSPGGAKWRSLLEPRRAELENALAALAGAPYKARDVSFQLPDFVDIVVNAGDSRTAFGATIGQSLPNFGPVANEGRGRTVAMTNFYRDADSLAMERARAEALLCPASMTLFTSDPEPQLLSTVLHEAAHNLGPAHQYAVRGRIDRDVFGGPLASTMEELKAQTAALYFTDWLAEKGLVTREAADRAHLRDLLWAFGHISRGMYDEEGRPMNYGQLAAIQLGLLLRDNAVTWNEAEKAANGADTGCFAVDPARFVETARAMMKTAAGIKARGDRKAAEKLVAAYVDDKGPYEALRARITERVLRAPKQSFLYSVRLE